jgi:glycosyltransferase involved in cell wall biosynthesis
MMSSAIFAFIATRIFGGRLVTTVHNSFDSHSFIMKLGDGFVAVSHAEAELLARRGFDSSSKFMIHNGPIGSVRQSFFAHIKDAIPSPCVVTLSGLHDRKRVQDVIHAFSEISPLFPKWKLVIIGEGPDEAKLKACAKKLGVEGSVIFFGSSLNPSYLLHQAQIFVSMSHSEPFGLAVVEARSAGCAIIVANAGGMPEVIEGGRAGIIIPPGDVKGLVRELKVILGDPEVLRKWQLASTLHGNIYSVSKMTEEYLRAYQSIIDRSNLGPMGLRSTISAIRRVLSLFLQK